MQHLGIFSCGTWVLHWGTWASLYLWPMGSVVVGHGFSVSQYVGAQLPHQG